MRFSLALLVAPTLLAGPFVVGTYNSSATTLSCPGWGSAVVAADCTVEYSSSALMPINNFAYILQASAGDRSAAAAGTDELSVLDFSGALNGSIPTGGGGDVAWTSGTALNFNVSYNAATKRLVYTVGTKTLNVTIGTAMLISDMFLRTYANAAGTTMKISDLVVDGVNMGAAQSFAQQAVATNQVSFLWISGLNNSFSMSGKLTMTWAGTPPTGTNVVSYMKFGAAANPPAPPPEVPEPATMAMMGAGLVGLALARRNKQVRRRR